MVQDLVSCIDELDTFPCNLASTALRTLQLAIPASDELVADLKSAHAAGEETLAINFLVLSVNLIPVPLTLTCLFMLPPHLLTLSTHHSHRP